MRAHQQVIDALRSVLSLGVADLKQQHPLKAGAGVIFTGAPAARLPAGHVRHQAPI
jgi:hypothetical protein